MKLKTIAQDELLFSYNIEDDRTNTYLDLKDYDWMQYILRTKFTTKELGTLDIEFEYNGCVFSRMKVRQLLQDKQQEYEYEYYTDVFVKYLRRYMLAHIAQWDSDCAFNGEDIALEFYNDVITHGKLCEETK